MRIKSPKLRFRSVTVDSLTANSASFNARLTGEVAVKNANFGKFKYPESTVSFLYRGSSVGTARIPSGRVKGRDTEKMNVTVAVEAKNDRNLGGDVSSSKVTLSSKATVEGKVHLFNVIKRKKTATMDCTMDVDTKTRFKFPEGKIVILYRNNSFGGAVISAGRAKARSTEKMNVTVVAESKDFGGEGKMTLSSNAVLNGRISVSKRKVKATMNCTMDVDTRRGLIDQFKCD
ncbi:hypothetical protein SASPL_151118 [Salvia splendens]|uniref:Late embryogenesis abundant protein LEA-2 subgroup domain-containing protein n=1 Tax=Salvia splendens TaxID=180675 RepID=A0A8X8W803_SALSN|nr:hypothetical protein SASPL_151118 [Salvia splendens]